VTKFILVRHGETEWNKIRRIQGSSSDIPLSEKGKIQAERAGLRLKDENIKAIYSSPLQRALHTAQAIASHHQLEVNVLPSLKEINVGDLEGMLAADLKMRFDEFLCQHNQAKELITLHGGESLCDVQKRAWDTIKSITSEHTEGTVVIVTHYFIILTVICQVLGLPLSQIIHLRLSTGTISSFTLDGDNRICLELFNDGCHSLNN